MVVSSTPTLPTLLEPCSCREWFDFESKNVTVLIAPLRRLVTLDWDVELLDFFGVKKNCLAKIVSNSEVYGTLSCTILKGTTISGLIGDQQSALVSFDFSSLLASPFD